MRHDIDRYKRMKYLKAVARVQYEFRDFLKDTDQKLLPQGLRTKDMQDFMLKARADQPPVTYRGQNEINIYSAIKSLLKRSERHVVSVRVGGKPEARYSVMHHVIRVGYMWMHKVHAQFYVGTRLHRNLRGPIILSAERVRLNHKSILLWEVTIYRNKEMEAGYVAQAKTEQRQTAYATKAHVAVRAVEDMMSQDIDSALGIN